MVSVAIVFQQPQAITLIDLDSGPFPKARLKFFRPLCETGNSAKAPLIFHDLLTMHLAAFRYDGGGNNANDVFFERSEFHSIDIDETREDL